MLGLAVLTVPGLREKGEPRMDESRIWPGGEAGGSAGAGTQPVPALRTQSELSKAATAHPRTATGATATRGRTSFGSTLSAMVRASVDAWGTPLIILVPEQDSLAIISAGPDLDYETDDDIVAKIATGTG
jgi:hypothetical protein